MIRRYRKFAVAFAAQCLAKLRKLRKFAIPFAVLYVALTAGFFTIMHRPIVFGEVMRHLPDPVMMVFPFKPLWYLARAGHVKVGDAAPDFNLPTADRKSLVSLALFRGKMPVILIFGSYT